MAIHNKLIRGKNLKDLDSKGVPYTYHVADPRRI